jgi:general secretion pathway protein M
MDATSLQDLRQQWQTRWSAMAPRERQLLTAAAWLLGLTLLVLVAIRPAWRTLSEAPKQLQALDAQLDDMRRLAREAESLRGRPPVPPAQAEAALKAATDRLGKGAQLSLQGDRATVSLSKVSGADLATWLDEVRAGARARPVEAQLGQVEPGLYAGSIVLALAPGGAPR